MNIVYIALVIKFNYQSLNTIYCVNRVKSETKVRQTSSPSEYIIDTKQFVWNTEEKEEEHNV